METEHTTERSQSERLTIGHIQTLLIDQRKQIDELQRQIRDLRFLALAVVVGFVGIVIHRWLIN